MTPTEKVKKIKEILALVSPDSPPGSTYYLRMLYYSDVCEAIRKVVQS